MEMKGKITHSFAQQVAAFIRRYRPALEALAKRWRELPRPRDLWARTTQQGL